MRKNLIAAYSGTLLNLLVPLVVTPFVLKALGPEAYGLVGVGLLLQSILTFMESGLSASLSRSFAERTATVADPDGPVGMHDLLRTLEYFYLALAVCVSLGLLLASLLIARYWITDHALPYAVVWQSIALMGLMIAMRFFASLYGGGLMGLQRQVTLNATTIPMTVLANIGAVVVLLWVSPDPRAYFAWLAVMGALTATALRLAVIAVLPVSPRGARFDWVQWRSIRKFSVGMSSLSVTSLAVTQSDKLLLSRLLPLQDFGFYSIASNMANLVQFITIPVQTVYYPRMTQSKTKGDMAELIATYRFASRLVALLVFPLGLTIALFSQDILLLWLRNPLVAEKTHSILSLLVFGSTLLTSLMMMPYTLTLAHADTKITLRLHLVLLSLQVPAVIFAATEFGAVGAAALWCGLFSIYGPVYAWRVNRKYLPSNHWQWLWSCVIQPALPALAVVLITKQMVIYFSLGERLSLLYLPFSWGLAQAAAWICAPLPGLKLRTLLRLA